MSVEREKVYETVPQKGFFGHPKGLFTLFFTEFWERFSYYGMRALLVLYMYDTIANGGLGMEQGTALAIFSIYGSLVYMSGIIGGWIADRILGTSNTVFYGGIFIMLGHLVLALPAGVTALFISMFLIIIGTGLLKPNVSSVVGDMYSPTDNRRDAGFSIFYMGVNAGAFIAPLVVSTVGEKYNYHLGFGIAAVGMLLGLIVFMATRGKKVFGTIALAVVVLAIFIVLTSLAGILTVEGVILFVSILAIVIPIIYFVVMYKSPKTTADERSRVLAYIPLFISGVMFWAIQ